MLITPEKIEEYKGCPRCYDFDNGYEMGSIDYLHNEKIKFTAKHSQAYRQGYIRGWCGTKQDSTQDTMHGEFWELMDSYHKMIDDLSNELEQIALYKFNDVPDYLEDEFKQAMYFWEHPEKCKPKKRIVARDGKIILKEGYDNG